MLHFFRFVITHREHVPQAISAGDQFARFDYLNHQTAIVRSARRARFISINYAGLYFNIPHQIGILCSIIHYTTISSWRGSAARYKNSIFSLNYLFLSTIRGFSRKGNLLSSNSRLHNKRLCDAGF